VCVCVCVCGHLQRPRLRRALPDLSRHWSGYDIDVYIQMQMHIYRCIYIYVCVYIWAPATTACALSAPRYVSTRVNSNQTGRVSRYIGACPFHMILFPSRASRESDLLCPQARVVYRSRPNRPFVLDA